MARSSRRSIAVPHPLVEGLALQLERRVIDYPSENAAINGLILYQLLSAKEHSITSRIAYLHPAMQDAVHDFALELNVRGLSLMGSFIRRVAERVVAGENEPDPDKVIKLHADQILDWAQRWQQGDETVWSEINPPKACHEFEVRFPGT